MLYRTAQLTPLTLASGVTVAPWKTESVPPAGGSHCELAGICSEMPRSSPFGFLSASDDAFANQGPIVGAGTPREEGTGSRLGMIVPRQVSATAAEAVRPMGSVMTTR